MEEIGQLLEITEKLKKKYDRRFTLDGKLVGDIGEVLAQEKYNIQLFPEYKREYDAFENISGKKIQIKSSMKGYYSFPYDNVPDYFLAILINKDSSIEEIYNGPGEIVRKYIEKKKLIGYRKSYYTITKNVLLKLNKNIDKIMKIKLKKKWKS